MSIVAILLVIALILFVLAGLPIPSPVGLGWWGLAFFTAAQLVGKL